MNFTKTVRPEKVIQFGEGGFLRGFVDWMLHKINQKSDFNGSVVVVQPIEMGMCDMLSAQGFAEVTLRLDNSDRRLSKDSDEVAVTRRYYRSGESEYKINGETVRLKDIHELFMDTGLGRDGYSMVSQGRIEDMVSAKSEDRREMFEEAAGISHYRYRRADALKRLSQAEENLLRLRDILTGLEERVGPLEKQSEKAQKFLALAAERKNLEIGLWLDILDKSAGLIREQNNKYTVAQMHYSQIEKDLESLAAEKSELEYALSSCSLPFDKLQEASRRIGEIMEETDGKELRWLELTDGL